MKERGNPYKLGERSLKLKNFSSQVMSDKEEALKHLKFFELSTAKFNDFRERVYVKRTSLLTEKITQFNLQKVDYVPEIKSSDTKDVRMSSKEASAARKMVNISEARVGSLDAILKYDITTYNALYDGKNMTKTTDKSKMTTELEAYLTPDHYLETFPSNLTLIVDFMSFVRSEVVCNNFTDFGSMVKYIFSRCVSNFPSESIHFVFDSYLEYSLKEGTRESRGQQTLELSDISSTTKIPTQLEKFWASSRNKQLFQLFAASQIRSLAATIGKVVVLSGMNIDGNKSCGTAINGQITEELESLKSDIEEADQLVSRV